MQRIGPANSATATDESAALLVEVRDFVASRNSLSLASLTPDGRPHASTAPFLASAGCFYLFLSDLSEHAANLRTHSRASILLHADECDTRQPFARPRLSFEVEAALIGRGQPLWQQRIDQMREKFGVIIDQLSQLPDFNLFELRPSAGRYVKGFGKAYALDGLETRVAVHMTGSGDSEAGGGDAR